MILISDTKKNKIYRRIRINNMRKKEESEKTVNELSIFNSEKY